MELGAEAKALRFTLLTGSLAAVLRTDSIGLQAETRQTRVKAILIVQGRQDVGGLNSGGHGDGETRLDSG